MKRRKLYTIMACLVASTTFSSCSDWFDVSPKTDVKADELFTTEAGFQSALAGVYIGMTGEETYGDNMSFGLLDQLAQMYDLIPDGANGYDGIYEYKNHSGWGTKRRLEEMWQKSYNLIANANNLMKWLDKNGQSVLQNQELVDMMRGEALALRAYIHFDLLRGWGPIDYRTNPQAPTTKTIPYRSVADNSKQPLLTAAQVLEKIEKDLLDAKKLLSFEKDLNLGDVLQKDRRFRFNYHAVNATLARVYAYMGRPEAIAYAQDVIDHCGLELQTSNSKSPVIFDEVICGLHMHDMEKRISSKFSDGDKLTTQYYSNYQTHLILFETGKYSSADIRSQAVKRYPSEEKVQSLKYINNTEEVVPLIRLPEMYYIICQMTQPVTEGAKYLNMVRHKRGYSAANDEKFVEEFDRTRALNREYRKEFYAEGQYFYFLKQHTDASLEHEPSLQLTEEHYVFPLPDAEREYGWTDEGEEEEEE